MIAANDRSQSSQPMIAAKGGASEPLNLGLPGKAGGAAAVRRTLASTICRIAVPTLVARPRQLRDVSTVMRFQPAHQSMINRRHDGRASCLAWYSPKQALERKPRIYAPATWKGGHESGRHNPIPGWAIFTFLQKQYPYYIDRSSKPESGQDCSLSPKLSRSAGAGCG